MMLLGNQQPSIGRIYKFGLMTTGFASGVTQDFETNYNMKAAKAFMKKHENATETVDCMFRFNEKYVKSMNNKKFKKIAAICILQGVEFDGCAEWNKRLAEAKKAFIKSEEVVDDSEEPKPVEEKKSENEKTESTPEVIYAPVVVTNQTSDSESVSQEASQNEKVIDASSDDVAEVITFDTQSKFIPQPVKKKKNAIFDMEAMNVDLSGNGEPADKYKKAFNKINEVVKAQKPRGTKHKLAQMPSGLIELQITDSNGNYAGTTYFDPYVVYGNRIYMQANSEIGGVVVPLERYDLINKYLSGYTLTAKEAKECKDFLFFNEDVYINIDMSEVKEFRKWTTQDYRMFGAKLEKILITLSQKIQQVPRFRFKEFTNSNKFTLVADGAVKNPNNYPLYRPDHEIEVKIAGQYIMVTENGETKKYKMA